MSHCMPPSQFSLFLAHSALFALCPFWIVLSVVTCPALMRFVSLRPNSPCWPNSRTPSLWASPVSLGQPVLVAGLLLLFRAHLWLLQSRQHPQRLLRRPRPVMRWRPLCCVPRHSGPPLPGRALALAHLRLCRNALHGRHVAAPVLLLVCVALLPSRSRDWSRAWPPSVAHQSRLPNCVSHVLLVPSTLLRQSLSPPLSLLGPPFPPLLPPRPLVSRSLRPTLTTNGTRSLTHTVSLALRLPLPSRLPPLELVGVLATSVADDSARLPSAPCGGTSSPLPLPVCPPLGRCVHAGGLALVLCTLSWVLSSYRPSRSLLWLWASLALRDGFGVVPGAAPRSVSLRSLWSSPRVARLLWRALPGLAWWPSHLAKRSHGCWACRSGPYPLAHRCGDCWWCHAEAHRAQHHRPWGVEFRRPCQAAVPVGVLSCRRALLPVFALCARPVFSTFA